MSFERKLFLLYVINDTLHQAKKKIDAAPAVSNRHPPFHLCEHDCASTNPSLGFHRR